MESCIHAVNTECLAFGKHCSGHWGNGSEQNRQKSSLQGTSFQLGGSGINRKLYSTFQDDKLGEKD